MRNGACLAVAPLSFRLQNRGNGLYSKLRSEFFKIRRWSLGLRRWMRGRTRQGEPGDKKECSDLMIGRFVSGKITKSLTRQIAN